MKIATWNVERPNSSSTERNQLIMEQLQKVNADILILTETNSLIHPGKDYNCIATAELQHADTIQYKPGENRTTIYSKYPVLKRICTYDDNTCVCATFQTPIGELIVYGTIIGIFGNRHPNFISGLDTQAADWKKLATTKPICIVGDFNISFSDNYYYTAQGRQKINERLAAIDAINLTESIPQNIDHIVVSRSFLSEREFQIETWNEDKKLSDHIGVAVTI